MKIYDNLIKKVSLSLVEKERLIECTFYILKEPLIIIQKEKVKIFLLSNPEFCDKFFITKNEIMRDLSVFETSSEGVLTYEEFY